MFLFITSRLDTFLKLSTLKAGVSNQGTLMHFLGLLSEKHSPQLIAMSEGWVGIWAASELSLTQIKVDLGQLDAQVKRVNAEFLRTCEPKDMLGIDGEFCF